MPTHGFSHYNLRVPRPQLEELRDFYRDIVGLVPGERPPFQSVGYWLYAGSRPVLHLVEALVEDGVEGSAASSPSSPHTFDHAAFECSDREAFEHRLAQRQIPYQADPVPQRGQVQLFFRDPAGHGVELNFQETLR